MVFRESDGVVDGDCNAQEFDSSGGRVVKSSLGLVVTIDGPAASGKSSVSREIARRFNWDWVSTGAFYRGVAWAANHLGLDLGDETAIEQFAKSPRWSIQMTSARTCFQLDGKDYTDEIGKEAVGSLASRISSYPKVRAALLSAQRECAKSGRGLVAEGRDCGSVVFPSADVKIFLTARAEDRAARRALEEGRDVQAMINEQKQRDAQDATRKAAPMVAASDAHTVDTTGLGLNDVVEKIETIIRAHLGQ